MLGRRATRQNRGRSLGVLPPIVTDPSTISGLKLLLNASLGVTGTAPISVWADQSGTGDANKDFYSSATEVDLTATDTNFNNLATLTDNNGDGRLTNLGNWAVALAQPCTWVFCLEFGTNAGTRGLLTGANAGHIQKIWTETGTGKLKIDAGTTLTGTADISATKGILVVTFNGASSEARWNKTVTTEISGNAGAQDHNGSALLFTDLASNRLKGVVAYCAAYNKALSQTEITGAMNYLASRYGVTLGT